MDLKKIVPILLLLIIISFTTWYYKSFKTIPILPAYENSFINEQGQPIQLSDLKGSYVLISYFQTWCGNCIQELRSIDALQTIVGKDKLKVLMVSDENFEKINRFKEQHCNTLNYFQTNKPLNELSIRIFPTTYLLDKNGIVVMSKLNEFNWSSEEVLHIIK